MLTQQQVSRSGEQLSGVGQIATRVTEFAEGQHHSGKHFREPARVGVIGRPAVGNVHQLFFCGVELVEVDQRHRKVTAGLHLVLEGTESHKVGDSAPIKVNGGRPIRLLTVDSAETHLSHRRHPVVTPEPRPLAQRLTVAFRLIQTAEVLGEVHPSAQRCRRHPFVGARGATHDVANGLGRTPAQHTRRHQFGRLEIDPIGIVQSSQVIPRTCELSKVLAQHLMRHRRENRCLPITSTLV
ncbi:Uncharacterised protein [Mycobacteroides abscessus subsp. abscessus]|nr:Uncharacterised protein [Mycobacteroides abscessus subsp. abscessus]